MSVVGVGSEQFFWRVIVETERKKDFYVGSFLKDAGVDVDGALQLIDANGVCTSFVTSSVQRVHNLSTIHCLYV